MSASKSFPTFSGMMSHTNSQRWLRRMHLYGYVHKGKVICVCESPTFKERLKKISVYLKGFVDTRMDFCVHSAVVYNVTHKWPKMGGKDSILGVCP